MSSGDAVGLQILLGSRLAFGTAGTFHPCSISVSSDAILGVAFLGARDREKCASYMF